MSQPSRPQARGPASRRRRDLKIETILPLEERCLLAPVLSISPRTAAFTAAATPPAGTTLGAVSVTLGAADPGFLTDAPFTSVTQLTPISSFGGDIVRIRSGPGGDFGKGVYAISRGAGENGIAAGTTLNQTTTPSVTGGAAQNRPGVIYRVDPATGKTSVFFDLNTVVNQLDKGANASNSLGAATGLVNWYDMTFDPEGYFDGRPSMFVASVDRTDPVKNAIYRIAPDGTLLGVFAQFSSGGSALKLNVNPSAILVPPPEDQTFLRGLLAGSGVSFSSGSLSALFFNANAFNPSTGAISSGNLPTGVDQTGLTAGNITGLTAANPDYLSRVYSTFTDFGTPAAGGIPATPGFSGVQGLNGELLINNGLSTPFANNASTDATLGDREPLLASNYRRFEDIAFDQYGYFAQGANIGAAASTGSIGGTGAGGGSGTGVGTAGTATSPSIFITRTTGRPPITLPPANAGNLFVADLASGLSVPIAVPTPTPGQPAAVRVPVQGPEFVTVTNLNGVISTSVVPAGAGLGGRIVRITPTGVVRNFAENFHTSNSNDARGFALSSLSITFSADGTTMYAADDDGIWQFKTVASLAGSTAGSLTGLNDLRSLAVPYEGQDSAVAILDTGVDARSSPFRGRVAAGTNIFNNGTGNDDTAVFGTGTTTGGNGGGNGGNGGNGGGNTAGNNPAPLPTFDGHGTPVAGVVAQYVPQATLVPINVFAPFLAISTTTGTTTGGGGGIGGGGGAAVTISANSNTFTTSQNLYKGLNYISTHPFANDPVRPGKTDRVIAATMGFGSTETFDAEGSAYRRYPQLVIAFKNQLRKFRKLGIAPIAAAGQFGAPFAAGSGTGTAGGGAGGGTTTTTNGFANNNAANTNVGDVQGMALPAILNEVISVTGSYSFPFATGPGTPPTNPPTGVVPRPVGPVLLFGNFTTIGGAAGGGGGTGGGGTGGGGTGAATGGLPVILTNADLSGAQYTDRILGAANRSVTTDFAAPALDVPTFRRTYAPTAGTGGTVTGGQDFNDRNTFNDAGTSLSAAEVTGAYAVVSSALNYWATLNHTGVTSDAYLTQPIGVHTLNFGPHAFKDMTAYNNPDGINAILQWTAVPANDPNDALSASTPQQSSAGSGALHPEFHGLFQNGTNALLANPNNEFLNYSRISVGNAIAAIEGEIALQYLIDHDDLKYIDTNANGIITAQELQTFVDTAVQKGLPEAGAMARLLGGTARPDPNSVFSNPFTLAGEQPDQPDVLQRRFNFFDYAADGNLNGSVTTTNLAVLAHTLLPTPDSFVINDRQRSSVNGYLLAPVTQRNTHELTHISPKYQFVPRSAVLKYRNVSPTLFRIGRGQAANSGQFPVYTLYDGTKRVPQGTVTNAQPSGNTNGGTASTGTASSGSSQGVASKGGTANGNATAVTSDTSQGSASVPVQGQAAVSATVPVVSGGATNSTTNSDPTIPASGGAGAASTLAALARLIDQANGTGNNQATTQGDTSSSTGTTVTGQSRSSAASISSTLAPTAVSTPTPNTSTTGQGSTSLASGEKTQVVQANQVTPATTVVKKKKSLIRQIFG